MKFTEHEGGMSFKLNTIEQTLSVYLQWEGIIGYDYMILRMKDWSEDDIDDVLREEGIYGFSGDIYTILQGKAAFCAGMELEDFLNVCREQGIDVSGEKPDISIATESSFKKSEADWDNDFLNLLFKWVEIKDFWGSKLTVQVNGIGTEGADTGDYRISVWSPKKPTGYPKDMIPRRNILRVLDEESSTEQMHAGPIDYIKNDLSRAKIKYSFDDEDTFTFDNYDDMRQAEEIICQVVGNRYNKSGNSVSVDLDNSATESDMSNMRYYAATYKAVDSSGKTTTKKICFPCNGTIEDAESEVDNFIREPYSSVKVHGSCNKSLAIRDGFTYVAEESFEEDFNKKTLQDASLNKDKNHKEYSIGSNKLISQTGDTRTLNRLKKLAEQLERDSELGFKYIIEDGYEDVGADMKWTSIVAVRPDGSSHWAISPGEWVTLANGDDDSIIDVVQASIQSDEFFQDKKEKEPMNKRVITSAKEDYKQASLKMDKFMSDDVLDRFYSAKTEEELVNVLEDGIIDYDKFYSYAGKNASVTGFARYLFNSEKSAKEDLEDYDILDRYRFSWDYTERTKYLVFDIMGKEALSEFIDLLGDFEDVTDRYEEDDTDEYSNYQPGGKVYKVADTLFFIAPDKKDIDVEDHGNPEETFTELLENEKVRNFLERLGLIVEFEEDEIRDNLGLEPLEEANESFEKDHRLIDDIEEFDERVIEAYNTLNSSLGRLPNSNDILEYLKGKYEEYESVDCNPMYLVSYLNAVSSTLEEKGLKEGEYVDSAEESVSQEMFEGTHKYNLIIKCNDEPPMKVTTINYDVESAIATAKNHYERLFSVYADDRKNTWVIDEILEDGKATGVPFEYTEVPDGDINNAFEDYNYSVAANLSMQIDEAESDEDLEEALYAIESAYEDGDITEEEYKSLKEDLGEK